MSLKRYKPDVLVAFFAGTVELVAGIALFIFGEYDDSPGGQLLGVFIAILGLRRLYKLFRS